METPETESALSYVGPFLHGWPCTGRAGRVRREPLPEGVSIRGATEYGILHCPDCGVYRFDVHVVTGAEDCCVVPDHHGCELHSLHAGWPLDRLIEFVRVGIEGGERFVTRDGVVVRQQIPPRVPPTAP